MLSDPLECAKLVGREYGGMNVNQHEWTVRG